MKIYGQKVAEAMPNIIYQCALSTANFLLGNCKYHLLKLIGTHQTDKLPSARKSIPQIYDEKIKQLRA